MHGSRSAATRSQTGGLSLIELAQPELVRNNAFRVLGLPTSAHAREVSKRLELLRLSATYGANARGAQWVLALPGGADDAAMAAAGHRLSEPSLRLVDELLWFWSPPDDPGMNALRAGNVDAARDAWTRQARDAQENVKSVHDLAVLHLTSAVDCDLARLTETGNKETGDGKWASAAERDAHWAQAIARWHQTVSMPGFWNDVGARMRGLDDPQLTTAAAQKLRAEFPASLLLVMAQIALRYAEAGDQAQGKSLRARMHWPEREGPHNSEAVVKLALERAVAPLRARLVALTKPSVKSAEANPSEGLSKAKQLLDATRPLLATVDLLLEATDPILIGVHDDVVGSIHRCVLQSVYQRVKVPEPLTEVEFWTEIVSVTDLLTGLAASASTRETLTSDRRTFEGNVKRAEDGLEFMRCWFCAAAPRVESVDVKLNLYGNVVRTPTWNGTNVTWKKVTVSVPRCVTCERAHATSATSTGSGCGLGVLAGVGVGIWLASNGMEGPAFVVGALIALAGWGIGAAVGASKRSDSVKPESHGKQFPAVQQLLSQGWAFGEGPTQ